VIKQVAAIVGPRYKVNLMAPDKVIIIEIFQVGLSSPLNEEASGVG
jgi:tRNA(Ser,Leu) C12 N-acetylase TAN1